jgi:hypothetical protein
MFYGWRRTRPREDDLGFEAFLTVPPGEVDPEEFSALMDFIYNNQIGGDEPLT